MPSPVAHLSYSSINLYFTCPRAWRLKYIDRMPSKTTPALVLGSAFHTSIERIIAACARGEQPNPVDVWQTSWDEATSRSEVDWDGEIPEAIHNQGLRLLMFPETLKTLGSIQPMIDESGPVIERKIELRVPGVPVPVIGYMDMLSIDGVPCDFKTSAKAWSQTQAEKELQPVYYLAALNQTGYTGNPGRRFRHYVWTKTKTPQVQTIETKRSAAELLWLLEAIQNVWRGIESGIFPPNPSSWKCTDRMCDAWNTCRGRR